MTSPQPAPSSNTQTRLSSDQLTVKMLVCAAGFVLAACATAPNKVEPAAGVSAPTAPARPAIDPGEILGKTPAAVDQLLGPPALTRREGRGEFRRYSLGDCALLVMVYPDGEGDPRVTHLDAAATSSGAEKPSVERCLGGA